MFAGCAFVQFTTRGAAEKAADATFNKLTICGSKVTIRSAPSLFSLINVSRLYISDGASLTARTVTVAQGPAASVWREFQG